MTESFVGPEHKEEFKVEQKRYLNCGFYPDLDSDPTPFIFNVLEQCDNTL